MKTAFIPNELGLPSFWLTNMSPSELKRVEAVMLACRIQELRNLIRKRLT